jgi:hypothetical protein
MLYCDCILILWEELQFSGVSLNGFVFEMYLVRISVQANTRPESLFAELFSACTLCLLRIAVHFCELSNSNLVVTQNSVNK